LDELSLDGNVGIRNSESAETTIVYPNPVLSEMHIVNSHSSNGFKYTLHDITGKTILERNQCFADEIINTENILPGVYFLRGVSKEKSFTKKIILQ
jgi:hypothetical protein